MTDFLKLPDPAIKHEGENAFKMLSPGGGEIFEVGSTIQIVWTGGPPLPQDILLSLVNINQWTVVNIPVKVENPNNHVPGICTFKIPNDFFYGLNQTQQSPTDYFQFCIGDKDRTTWLYGPTFTIWCSATQYNPDRRALTEPEVQAIVQKLFAAENK